MLFLVPLGHSVSLDNRNRNHHLPTLTACPEGKGADNGRVGPWWEYDYEHNPARIWGGHYGDIPVWGWSD